MKVQVGLVVKRQL